MNMRVQTGVIVTLVPFPMDPDRGRVSTCVPVGSTIEQIVRQMLPKFTDRMLDRVRVALVREPYQALVARKDWKRVRPKDCSHVLITIAPGDFGIMLALQFAAKAIANFAAPALSGTLGLSTAAWTAIIGFGVTALGSLLINALFAPKKKKEDKATFIIDGWQNQARPGEQLPVIFGETRSAPVFAASSYVEVVGDVLYNRALFLHTVGNIELWKQKLGDTDISEYDEFQVEHRNIIEKVEGEDDIVHPDSSEPFTLYAQQVYEDRINTDLVLELIRDDSGEVEPGNPYKDPKPVRRSTGQNASHAIVILNFPTGLAFIDKEGSKKPETMTLERRMRKAGADIWIDLPDYTIRYKKTAGFFRAIRFDFPERGAWEIELTRITPSEVNSSKTFLLTCTWSLLQTFRPEYPINTDLPLAMTAMRVKGTAQMNGTVETYNAVTRRIVPDFGIEDWPADTPRNPATSALLALMGDGCLVKPVALSKIDVPAFVDWHQFCVDKGLKFDFTFQGGSLDDALKMIGAAGRAAIYFNGTKWTVLIDRPRTVVTDILTPRNSSGFSFETAFPNIPEGITVKFQDASNDFETATRTIKRPGFVGDPQTIELIEMPGKTDAAEIYIETNRKFFELQHRTTMYRSTQDGLARSATRGDLVVASHDIVKTAMASGRVKAVRDAQVEIDEVVTFQEGVDYAVGFRTVGDDDPGFGEHHVRPITVLVGDQRTFLLQGEGVAPEVGSIVMFGPSGSESIRLILAGVQRRDDGQSDLFFMPSAEIIDELTDALVVPPWDSKVGEIPDLSGTAPLPPVILSVLFDDATDDTLVVLGPDPASVIEVDTYEFQHRLAGSPTWIDAAVVGDTVTLTTYAFGDEVEMHALVNGTNGTPSAYSDIVTYTIGTNVPMLPPVIAFDATRMPSGIWRYEWTVGALPPYAVPITVTGARLRYRAGVWSNWSDLNPLVTGLATTSPWDSSTPIPDGLYTFGIQLVGDEEEGEEGTPVLIVATAPAATVLLDDTSDVLLDDTSDVMVEG